MAEYTYRTNEQGFQELLGSKALSDAMVKIAEPALAEAKNTAPKDTKAFSKGFSVKPALVPGGRKGELRAGAVIENSVPYARYVMDKESGRSFMWTLGQKLQGEVGK